MLGAGVGVLGQEDEAGGRRLQHVAVRREELRMHACLSMYLYANRCQIFGKPLYNIYIYNSLASVCIGVNVCECERARVRVRECGDGATPNAAPR